MKIRRGIFVLVVLLAGSSAAWAQADPAKEVADIARQRGQAIAKNDLDGFMENVADNVVFTSGRAGFRIEGKAAMRTYYAQLAQHYPTRQFVVRQPSSRVFQNGTVVVRNFYSDGTIIDRNGNPSTAMNRISETWIKTDGRWLLVDQHISSVPGTQ